VGPLARLASRWHVRDRHRGAATLTADARGVSGEGQGTLGADEAFLALEGRIATAPEMYAATARAPEAAFAPHVAGRVGVAAAGSTVAAAARLTTLSDRRAATRTNLPTARLALSSEGEHLRLDADVAVVAERVADGTAPEGHTVDSTLAAIAADSVGPFRLAARAVAETLAAQHDDAQSTTVGGHLGGLIRRGRPQDGRGGHPHHGPHTERPGSRRRPVGRCPTDDRWRSPPDGANGLLGRVVSTPRFR
jgi:hypothetical protein